MPGVRRRVASAMILVIRSSTTTIPAAVQKIQRSEPAVDSAALPIFLFLLAGDAQPRVRERVEALEVDLLTALVAMAELLRRAVEAAERLVHVPEIAAFLRGEEELLLPLHGVGALVRHVERVGRQIAVGRLQRGVEGLVVVAQLLHHARPLFEESLLEVRQLLLVHSPSLGCGPAPFWPSRYRCTPTITPCPSISTSCSRSGAGARRPSSSRRASVSPWMNAACPRTASTTGSAPAIQRPIRSV